MCRTFRYEVFVIKITSSPSFIPTAIGSGMIPHKTSRGDRALKRLRTFEDIPARYTKQKTFVVPLAMRVLSLQLGRKYCTVGRLSHEVGWKYKHVVEEYERKRIAREELNAKKLSVKRVSTNSNL